MAPAHASLRQLEVLAKPVPMQVAMHDGPTEISGTALKSQHMLRSCGHVAQRASQTKDRKLMEADLESKTE